MTTLSLSAANPSTANIDALVVGLFAGDRVTVADGDGDAAAGQPVRGRRSCREVGEVVRIPSPAGVRAASLVGVGLGKPEDFDAERVRRAAGAATRALAGVRSVGSLLSVRDITAAAEGHLLGAYVFDRYKEPTKDGAGQGHPVRRRRRGRPEAHPAARRGHRRGGVAGPRPGEHRAERPAAGGVRRAGVGGGQDGRHERAGAGREGAAQGRVRRHPRGRIRLLPAAPAGPDGLQAGQAAGHRRAGRQGHLLRLRRAVDQAVAGHGEHDLRHGRRGRRHRDGDRRGRAGTADPGHRLRAAGGEHAVRFGVPARRRAAPLRRQDRARAEHRRRGPAGAGRRDRAGHRGRSRLPDRDLDADRRPGGRARRPDHGRDGRRGVPRPDRRAGP